MEPISLIVGIVVGVALGAGVVHLTKPKQSASSGPVSDGGVDVLRTELRTAKEDLKAERTHLDEARKELATLTERERGLQEKFSEQKALLEEMQTKLHESFDAASRKALQDNNKIFNEQAEERMKPLREQLTKQEELVQALAKERTKQFGEIGELMKTVLASNTALQNETKQLESALKRPDQRGRWGEVQLQRIVEMAGMTEHCDFSTQTHTETESGAHRPDMVVHLPGGGSIAVDSKVPLSSYLDAMENEDQREELLDRHVKAVQDRWKELAKKAYWDSLDHSPEVVVMFIPVESALTAAMERKPTMHADALENKVLIATPTLLIGLLRTAAYGWRQEALADNAKKIADLGKELHDRIGTFVGHLGKVGKELKSATDAYNKSVSSLDSRLLVTSRKLSELGVSEGEHSTPDQVSVAPSLPSGTDTQD